MANCSIPNSTPATGRTSTLSSRRLKNSSRASASFLEALGLTNATLAWTLRFFNVQRSTLNAQRSIQIIGRWMLDVGRWTFSSSWRVKGAWWPSRSSKPPSDRFTGRGAFDSLPLRHSQCRMQNVECRFRIRRKGVLIMSREQILKLTSLSSCAG